MTALLEVQNLEKQFPIVGSRKVVQAVNGVDFVIESGETLALVGESGSGKTTIGRAVVGLIEATTGEIRFDGKQMGRGRDIRSRDIRSIRVSVSARPWPNRCAIWDYRERTARRACAMWPRGLVSGSARSTNSQPS
jgi:ABC-type oligopeptide transport system ATPase subunit